MIVYNDTGETGDVFDRYPSIPRPKTGHLFYKDGDSRPTILRGYDSIDAQLIRMGVGPDYSGPVCLDLEFSGSKSKGIAPALWDAVIQGINPYTESKRLRDAFEAVVALRPRAQVGLYHFPVIPYAGTDKKRHAAAALSLQHMQAILRESGALFPSVYDAHQEYDERDYLRHGAEVLATLQIASQTGAEVIVYMTHRWVGGKEFSGHLIPRDDFKRHIAQIVTKPSVRRPWWRWLSGLHERVAGVALWGADRWYAENNTARAAIIHKERGSTDVNEWVHSVAIEYLTATEEAVNA